MSSTQKHLTPRIWAELFLLAVLWGAVFFANRIALDEIGPLTLVAHRALWAALLLWLVIFATRTPLPRSPRLWGVLLAALFLPDERLTLAKTLGIGLGFFGVATAIGLSHLTALDPRSLAQIAALLATLSYGFAGVWARKHLAGCTPLVASAGMLTCTTFLALPLAHVAETPFTLNLSASTWAALAYAAILGTAAAYLLYYRVLAAAGSGNLLVVTLLIPPVAILLGTAFLNEALPPRAFAGFALLTLGLIVLDGRLLARLRRKKPT